MTEHRVRVAPIPSWVDHERLLGPTGTGQPWRVEPITSEGAAEQGRALVATATLTRDAAADLAARLRGLGLDGAALVCAVEPALRRPVVRRARTEDARRRRDTTPGFERPGVRVDEQGRWSLTPERLALALARTAGGAPVVDATCGVGGNAIAFARTGSPVTAIEIDAARLAYARHNAGVYGVAERIRFVHGDARDQLASLADPAAILFVDPPWGPDWSRERCGLAELPLLAELLGFAGRFAAVWAKLPPSFAVTAELPGATAQAWFGAAEGDRRRIKFVLAQIRGRG